LSREWELGDVAALLGNPFYAINLHPSFARPHPHTLSETEWVQANRRAIDEFGARRWLEALLAALRQAHAPQQVSAELHMADPYAAVTVSPTLCEEHPPLVTEADWIAANERAVAELGEHWLRNLLAVLKGGFVR
jgi:hypothetical protein